MSQQDLDKLLELARSIPMSAGDKEEQRRSFAYGNMHMKNGRVTREMVDEAADRLGPPALGEPGGRIR